MVAQSSCKLTLHINTAFLLYGVVVGNQCIPVSLGQRDTPLSSVGMEQAGKLSQHFLREHLSHAFSSDLQRAAKVLYA